MEQPEFKVMNFGHIPGHEHEIDFFANMEKFAKAGKVNCNWWPKFSGESVEDYIRRLHKFASQGVLAPNIGGITEDISKAGFGTVSDVLKFWRELSK